MATNPNIILAAGQGRPQSVDYNSAQNLIDADTALKAKQDQQDRQQAMQAQNAFRTALQQSGGDYDRAIAQSEQQGYDMTPVRLARTKLQEEIYKAGTEQLNQHKIEDDLVGRIFNTMDATDPSSIQRGIGMLTRVDPNGGWDQIVGPNPTKEHLAQLGGLGMTAKEHADLAQKSLEAMKSGDWSGFLAMARKSSNSPEDWQGITQVAQRLGIPQEMVAHFAQMTPDQLDEVITKGKQTEEKLQSPEVEAIKAWSREHGGAQPTQKDLEQIHRGFKEAGTIVRVTPTAGGPSGELSPEGIDYAATQYRLTGKMPPLGMGRTPARAQIINAAAKQAQMLGQSPVNSIQKQAAYAGDSKALAQMQKMSASAEAFETKALGQAQIVDDLSDRVPRTFSPMLNKALLYGQTEIAGNKDATSLLNAIQTFTTEYAKIMTGSTNSAAASTDSARKEAATLLSGAMSRGTLKQQLNLMRREMALTMQGYDATINHISDRMGGQPMRGETVAAPTQAPLGPYDVQAPNGKVYHFSSQAQSDAFKKQAGIP